MDETRQKQASMVVPTGSEGLRLDRCLAEMYPDLSRVFFKRCIHEGRVQLNGHPCRAADHVHPNDLITLDWPAETKAQMTAEELPLNIIFEDDDLLVINKSPGIIVHPTRTVKHGTLVQGLLHHDEENFSELVDDEMRPGVVHRLDRDTSGLLVVAKNAEAQTRLKEAFKERQVEKTYLAIVAGEFGVPTGTIDAAIGRHPRNRLKRAVLDENGKHAVSHYRVLGSAAGATLLQIRIETGRTHQIRVHFAHLHHPVLGDTLYGGKQRKFGDTLIPRQMLHAWKLTFPHPRTGIAREYMAPLPDDFCQVLKILDLPQIAGCQ